MGIQHKTGERTSELRLYGMISKPSPNSGSHRVKTQQVSRCNNFWQNTLRVDIVSLGTAVRVLMTSRSTTAVPAMDENRAFIWRWKNTYLWVDQVSRHISLRSQYLHHRRSHQIPRAHYRGPGSAIGIQRRDRGYTKRDIRDICEVLSIKFRWCLLEYQGRTNLHFHSEHLLALDRGQHDRREWCALPLK